MLILFLILCLIGCTTRTETIKSVELVQVPKSFLTCQGAPDRPGDGFKNKDVAIWGTQLFYAHKDCQSKLEKISKLQ